MRKHASNLELMYLFLGHSVQEWRSNLCAGDHETYDVAEDAVMH